MSVTKLYKNLRQDRLASYKQLQTGRETRPVFPRRTSAGAWAGVFMSIDPAHPIVFFSATKAGGSGWGVSCLGSWHTFSPARRLVC